MMYTCGFGSPPAMHSPSTRLCRRRYSLTSAGTARLTASAILSDFQYDVTAITAEITSATMVPVTPFPMSVPTAKPTNTSTSTKPNIKKNVRRLFDAMRSFIVRTSLPEQHVQRLLLQRNLLQKNRTCPRASRWETFGLLY